MKSLSATQKRLDMYGGCHAAKILPVGIRGAKNVKFPNGVDQLEGLDLCLVVLPVIVEDCMKLPDYYLDIISP